MIGLTGSPQIDSVPWANQGAVTATAAPEARTREAPGGGEEVLSTEYRIEGRIAWPWLTEAQAVALQAALQGEVPVAFRTGASGDPAWAAEIEADCEVLSDVRLTESQRDGDGAVRFRVEAEVRSLARYTAEALGLSVGAFELVAEDAETLTLRPVDGATITDGTPQTVTTASGTYTISTYVLGDARTVAARTVPNGSSLIIQTRQLSA